MSAETTAQLEETFLTLPDEERGSIINLGVTMKLSYLRKRLYLAEGKVQELQTRYGTSLGRLDAEGLPDDAGFEMHEDVLMWHHWSEVAQSARRRIEVLEEVAAQGAGTGSLDNARA